MLGSGYVGNWDQLGLGFLQMKCILGEGLTLEGLFFSGWQGILIKESWDLVTRDMIRVTILITPIRVLITLLTKPHDPPSSWGIGESCCLRLTTLSF